MEKDEGLTALGLRIRSERELRRMTQEQLADKANCSKGAVSQWEKGNVKNIRLERLFLVADALGVTARWLATGKGAKEPFSAALAGNDTLLLQLINLYGQMSHDHRHELVRYANFQMAEAIPIASPSNPFPGVKTKQPNMRKGATQK